FVAPEGAQDGEAAGQGVEVFAVFAGVLFDLAHGVSLYLKARASGFICASGLFWFGDGVGAGLVPGPYWFGVGPLLVWGWLRAAHVGRGSPGPAWVISACARSSALESPNRVLIDCGGRRT